PSPVATLGTLSGGNQQKLVVGRALASNPALIIAAYPTRGVDIGATRRIHDELVKRRNSGAAILLISSELDEIMALSDNIAVLFDGYCAALFPRGQATELALGRAMVGAA
ncbi:MAG: ABC transporter ATP-binding protein, partial [Deltaproteobacteria bacterium]|nr:ABC transporter ATP-binding protein [Deltaproteobacteria bacterium]